jgi:hypothetical protein
VPGLLLLPSKKSRLRPAQYNSQYNSQYSTQIAEKRAISEFSTSGVPPVPWVVVGGRGLESRLVSTYFLAASYVPDHGFYPPSRRRFHHDTMSAFAQPYVCITGGGDIDGAAGCWS